MFRPAAPPPRYRPAARQRRSLPWPDAEVSAVAFRLHALRASERASLAFLVHLESAAIRRLRPYVDRISDADLGAYLTRSEHAGKSVGDPRRGDLLQVRTSGFRWPWRTSTGMVGDDHAA